MNNSENRTEVVKRASWIGIIGNTFLALLKISTGLFSGSLAVLGDGIDSATDILTSTISLFAAHIMNKPPDRDHPYGHGRVETLASKIISFVVFFAGIQLGTQAVQQLISGKVSEIQWIAIIVTLVSIAGKLFLALYKFIAAKRIDSALLRADAKNMRNDVVISTAVLIGLGLGYLTGYYWLDCATALLMSFWIVSVAFGIYRESEVELMEGHDDWNDYKNLFDAVEGIAGASHPHKVRIRRMGVMLIIDLDIEVDGLLSVEKGHAIAIEVEMAIKEAVENVYDVQVHVEPVGNCEQNERYGVTKSELKKIKTKKSEGVSLQKRDKKKKN